MFGGHDRGSRVARPAGLVAIGIVLVALASSCGFTTVTWAPVADAPVLRTEAMGAVVAGRLWVLGGYDGTYLTPLDVVTAYDPATDSWAPEPSLPDHLSHAAVAVDGTDLYLAGGYHGPDFADQVFGSVQVWRLDTVAGSYAPLPDLPEARGSGGFAVVGHVLHFFGGNDTTRADRGEHWSLDLGAPGSGWRPEAPLPDPRTHFGYVVLGGLIYAFGGQHGEGVTLDPRDTVNVWDPAQPSSWRTIEPMPVPLSHMGAASFVDGHRIIVLGGAEGNFHAVATTWAFDPADGWTALTPLPDARNSAVAGVIGGNLYLTGGSAPGGVIAPQTWSGVPAS